MLEITAKVVGNTNGLIQKLSGSSNESTESLTKDLTAIATETQTIGTLVAQTLPTVQEETTAGALLQIGNCANTIGNNLKSVQGTLTKMSESTLTGTDALQRNLNKLQSQLNDVSEIISKKDAQKVVNVMDSLKEASHTLEKILSTLTEYNEKLLANKEDFKAATNTMLQLVDELNAMDTLSLNMIANLQNMLDIISSDIYHGTNATADALMSVNSQLTKITSQSSQIKKSKDDVKKIVDDKMDELEEKTTIFNLEQDAKVISFGSEKNEYVESVQFVLKTPDIKKVKVHNEDIENKQESVTFWEKVISIFQKIWNWITGLFQ